MRDWGLAVLAEGGEDCEEVLEVDGVVVVGVALGCGCWRDAEVCEDDQEVGEVCDAGAVEVRRAWGLDEGALDECFGGFELRGRDVAVGVEEVDGL